MTKKHFEALANALVESRPTVSSDLEWSQWQRDIIAVANVCLDKSRNFDYQRFIDACKNRTKDKWK